MIRTLLFFPLLAFMSQTVAAPVTEGQPLKDPASETWIPGNLDGCVLRDSRAYENPAEGISYKFSRESSTGVATLFIYDGGRDTLPDDTSGTYSKRIVDGAISTLRMVEEKGIYKNVNHTETKIISWKQDGGAEAFRAFASATYSKLEGEEKKEVPVRSLIAATIFNKQIFKLRYTERVDLDGNNLDTNDLDARAKGILNAFDQIFNEQRLLESAKGSINTFLAAPASTEGQAAGRKLFEFASAASLPAIEIDISILSNLGKSDEESEEEESVSLLLLQTYIAGNVAEQITSESWKDSPEPGFAVAKSAYKALRKKDSSIRRRPTLE
ncbi:hypothetical protein OAF27_01010 [Verrucomicrobiales bacterium]|nr:hypothetical protein [Verrucomicrobiales bacterium]